MMGTVRQIRWDDPAEAISAFLTMVIMPLSYSIADGLAVGGDRLSLVKILSGQVSRDSHSDVGVGGVICNKVNGFELPLEEV